MGTEHIGVTTLTFQAIGLGMGHFLLVVLWKSLSPTVSEIFRPKHHVLIDTILNRHHECAISRDMYPLCKI